MGCKPCEKPKAKHRKGLWSPEEDLKLKNYVLKHGHFCWSSVPINAGLQRNGKSCRLRWINYLRPGLKRGMFTPQEDDAILSLHHLLGNNSTIAKVENVEAQHTSSTSESTVPMHFDLPQRSPLPKLLFAEWLSLDEEGGRFGTDLQDLLNDASVNQLFKFESQISGNDFIGSKWE
ncbi:hypothetical protein ES319_D08G121500v1 [Gossypium barbadense]|uniref:Uncharacterized protein n=1 Tax=Gossypium barbadense TaxID=3634 RepID=A0A5J5QEP3_GOSBA|nr:hypothetical protein ES319_D08G121500v1 [Gossypium barbadense]